eukprot:915662-Pyramimonas_sp.AAC.1
MDKCVEMCHKVKASGVIVGAPMCAEEMVKAGAKEECVKLLCAGPEDQTACADKVAEACFDVCNDLCPTHGGY